MSGCATCAEWIAYIPTLSYTNNNLGGFTGTCVDSRLASNEAAYLDRWEGRNTPVKFKLGQTVIDFYSTREDELPGDIARFSGQDADYVSASNWYIRCVPVEGSYIHDYNDEFHLYSPDGTVYIMGKGGASEGTGWSFDGIGRRLSTVTWRVTKIIDPYGNYLDYVYENNDFYGTSSNLPRIQNSLTEYTVDKLEKIVASDGREVTFSYEWANSYLIGGQRVKRWRLLRVESNGAPRKHVIDYKHEVAPLNGGQFANAKLTVTYDDTSSLVYEHLGDGENRITYPNGGSVTYGERSLEGYHVSRRGYAESTSYENRVLAKRTVKNAAGEESVFTYSYQIINSDKVVRKIDTPSHSIELEFKKSHDHHKTLRPQVSVEVDDGKILSKRIYDRKVVAGQSKPTPLYEKNYTYKVASAVTTDFGAKLPTSNYYYYSPMVDVAGSLQMNGTTNIVPDVVTTITSSTEYPNVTQTFVRSFESYDSYGFPTLIKETSASGKVRYITKTYKNDFANWIRGKTESTIISETIDGVAANTEILGYNVYGDISSISDNGIVTTMIYHEFGVHDKSQIKITSDALGNTYTYHSYFRGIATNEENERGLIKTAVVDTDGTVQSTTRFGDTLTESYVYDQARRLKSITSPRAETAQKNILWDGVNKKTETQGNLGNWKRETVFDGFGRVIFDGSFSQAVNYSYWRSVAFKYDVLGRKVFESYPSNFASDSIPYDSLPGITYYYDSAGRVTRVVKDVLDNEKVEIKYSYASEFNDKLRIKITDERSKITLNDYDSYGEPSYEYITKQVSANGVEIIYGRDVYGRLYSFNRGGLVRSYDYYPQEKTLKSIWNPENGFTNYEYYPNGRLKKKTNHTEITDYVYHPDGTFDYVAMSGNGDSVTRSYSYDGNSNLRTATTQTGTAVNSWSYTYDSENNLRSETTSVPLTSW